MYDFMHAIANPVGILGVILLLIAYFLLSTGRLQPNKMNYQLLNFFGALLILYSLFFYWNLSSVIIEIAWIGISLVGMYRAVRA